MANAKDLAYSAGICVVAVSGWAGMLHFWTQYETAHQANIAIVRGIAADCRPQRIGQSATYLVDSEGRPFCQFTDHGVPKDVWLNLMKKRKEKI